MFKFKLGLRLTEGRAFIYDLVYDTGSKQIVRGYVHAQPGESVKLSANLASPKFAGYRGLVDVRIDVHKYMSSRELAYMANQALLKAEERFNEFLKPARLAYYRNIIEDVSQGIPRNTSRRYIMTSDGVQYKVVEPGDVEFPGLAVIKDDKIEIVQLHSSVAMSSHESEEDLPF